MSLFDRFQQAKGCEFERAPFVFSYDISGDRTARSVRRCLRRWRLDGQLSVHEVVMTPPEAEALGAELIELLDPETDHLILLRLSRRGNGPVMTLATIEPALPLAVRHQSALPAILHDGSYVVAYDVTNPKRLRRVHRVTSRNGIFLQRSVYFFVGQGSDLMRVLQQTSQLLMPEADDFRVYALGSTADLWFLCGRVPPLSFL